MRDILASGYAPHPAPSALRHIWNGAELPTDHVSALISTINALADALGARNVEVSLPVSLDEQDKHALETLRYDLEEQFTQASEQAFASEQADQIEDIVAYLRALKSPRKSSLFKSSEAPVYLEWAIWRAFLAINTLTNHPWEARRFTVSPTDFSPVSHAPSNGADIIVEFDDFAVVVEVALSTSSRQEGVEGEPVRRHVADIVTKHRDKAKTVYGLFIANSINSNTAETFRIGSWYNERDEKAHLRIVPLTLDQFTRMFETGFKNGRRLNYRNIEAILRDCLAESNADAPIWKRLIGERIEKMIQRMESPGTSAL